MCSTSMTAYLAAILISIPACMAAPQAADFSQAVAGQPAELSANTSVEVSQTRPVNATFSLATAPIGPKVVGSSGAHAQMVFLPPFTNTAVFIDNYHPNFGNGIDLKTGAHSKEAFKYPNSDMFVFGTEYDLATNEIRPLRPISNTFCSAGAFFPNGTLLNTGGAEPCRADGFCFGFRGTGPVENGFNRIRTFPSGPCPNDGCEQDWIERGDVIQRKRWYHTMITLTTGSILLVGGSNVGGLVLNAPDINEANYEIAHQNGTLSPVVDFPFLAFTDADGPEKSYNLYPTLHLLPNANARDDIFTLRGSDAIIWNYVENKLVKQLPSIEDVRTFPASAMSVLLPLKASDYFSPEVLVCGGATGDAPDPKALNTCGRMSPLAGQPEWEMDVMPDGSRVMGDMILLPSGEVFIVNGARHGSGGGHMAEVPALTPIMYDPEKPIGERFNVDLPESTIPRMYHSVAMLMPSGEVLVAGSNPAVLYAAPGSKIAPGNRQFNNNGKLAPLRVQQNFTTSYPTEYRVEVFSPPYMSAPARPVIENAPTSISYGGSFNITVDAALGCNVPVKLQAIHTGFATHGVNMGQRMAELEVVSDTCGSIVANGLPNQSVMPPGVYLLFAVQDGIPSTGEWVKFE